jgi:hypothetical protein
VRSYLLNLKSSLPCKLTNLQAVPPIKAPFGFPTSDAPFHVACRGLSLVHSYQTCFPKVHYDSLCVCVGMKSPQS